MKNFFLMLGAWIISWLFYSIGHIASLLMGLPLGASKFSLVLFFAFASAYQKNMIRSVKVQDFVSGAQPYFPWGKTSNSD